MEITRQPIKVLYLETDDTPQGIPPLFDKLFSLIPDPQKRKCFGASTGPTGTYRACVEKIVGDDAHALGMQEWELPGGLFAVERVEDWPGDTGKIGLAFQRLLSEYENRISNWGWGLEDYLTENTVDVLIMINP